MTFLTSCQNEIKAKFEITNRTNTVIDSINIKSNDHNNTSDFIKLEKDESKIYFMDMTDLPKVDGDYLLSFRPQNTGVVRFERFGYFTNGYPLEDVTKIIFETDTVIIDLIYKQEY